MNIVIPKPVNEILNIIYEHNYEAYITGGTIRNMVMGEKIKNYNISTDAPVDEIKKILKNYKSYYCGKDSQALAIVNSKFPMNIIQYCGENNDLESHLAEMDFTMNALAYSDDDGLIDYSTGLIDIRDRIIRANVGEEQVFIKDPLRILRAIRLSAEYGMRIETQTKEYMFENKELLKKVAPERIRDEFSKILVCPRCEFYIKKYLDIFLMFIPELSLMENFKQNNPEHIYDVLDHTLVTMKCIEPKLELRLAMLLHDSGKPLTYTQDENGIGHFDNHQIKSAEIARDVLNRLRYNKKTINKVVRLVEYHDYRLPEDEENLKLFISKFGSENLDDLFKVKTANQYGKNPSLISELTNIKNEQERVSQVSRQAKIKRRDLKISGKDLIKMGFEQDQIGLVLDELYRAVILSEVRNNFDKLYEYALRLKEEEKTKTVA